MIATIVATFSLLFIKTSRYFLIFGAVLIGSLLSPQIHAQNQGPSITFDDLSDKFVRNLDLIRTMIKDEETRLLIDVVIGQTQDVIRFYSANSAKAYRVKLQEYKERMKTQANISRSDQKRIQDLRGEIKERDPKNEFGKAKNTLKSSIGNLTKSLDQLYPSDDPKEQDIIRIIKQHLHYYGNLIDKQ